MTERLVRHIQRTGNRVVRPRDLDYADPHAELHWLARHGSAQRVAHGYYLIPPESHRKAREWRPSVEAVALGIAIADYGPEPAALMGPSAARLRGAPPRALATAVIAIPKSYRHKLVTALGTVQFVSRDAKRLDLVKARTEVVEGWRTSDEQTVLDVADRPGLGGITASTASEIIAMLAPSCDWDLMGELARRQHKRAGLARASWLAAAVTEVPAFSLPGPPAPSLGLEPASPLDPSAFGVQP